MNKRIKELADRAEKIDSRGIAKLDIEKFAKLIINECINVAEHPIAVQNIKHYFGE